MNRDTKAILSVSVTSLLFLISHRVRRKQSQLINLSLKTALPGWVEIKSERVFLAIVSDVNTRVLFVLRIME